jgi:hypothetical protein
MDPSSCHYHYKCSSIFVNWEISLTVILCCTLVLVSPLLPYYVGLHASPLITSAGCCMSILSMDFLGGWTWLVDGELSVTICSCEDVNSGDADDGAPVPLVDPRLHNNDEAPQYHQL